MFNNLASPSQGAVISTLFLFALVLSCLSTRATADELPRSGAQEEIRENYKFGGLAFYYNQVTYYSVHPEGTEKLHRGSTHTLNSGEWLAAVGRLDVLLVQSEGHSLSITEDGALHLGREPSNNFRTQIASKAALLSIAPELDSLRYAHLWPPLAWMSKLCESTLEYLATGLGLSWGWAIMLFALVLRIVLLPLSLLTGHWQQKVRDIQSTLAPKLAEIKANFDGEEAHNRLMEAHSNLGVSPFYTLKPMLGTLIQIPVLIAAFNALGEMPQLKSQSFGWINDLAYPDAIISLTEHIPLLGSSINLLPFAMTIVTLVSGSRLFGGQEAAGAGISRWLLAAVFFLLFFPFPAAMVLFWTVTNLLQLIQSRATERPVSYA